MAWDTYDKGDYDVWVREFDAKGKARDAQPAANSPNYEARPTMTYDTQGRLWVSWELSGQTWGKMSALELPNPNAGTDAVTLRDGRHLLVYNHTPKGRSPLNVAVSADGRAWQAALVLESEPGEYSYPAVIQTGDGLVHITHTWKRERVQIGRAHV